MTLLKELENRFGAEKVKVIYYKNSGNKMELDGIENYPFILIEIQMRSPIKILMTGNLSEFKMSVPEKFEGKEYKELYFCLPNYWDIENQENDQMNWVFEILFKLQKHVKSKETWLGVGHTLPFTIPISPISKTMNQKYFFLNEAVFLKDKLFPLEIENKQIEFLSIIPIYEDEFDYKVGKGTYKFQKKLAQKNVTELLDDYRGTVLKNNWKFFELKN
jgi:hypothetical protein